MNSAENVRDFLNPHFIKNLEEALKYLKEIKPIDGEKDVPLTELHPEISVETIPKQSMIQEKEENMMISESATETNLIECMIQEKEENMMISESATETNLIECMIQEEEENMMISESATETNLIECITEEKEKNVMISVSTSERNLIESQEINGVSAFENSESTSSLTDIIVQPPLKVNGISNLQTSALSPHNLTQEIVNADIQTNKPTEISDIIAQILTNILEKIEIPVAIKAHTKNLETSPKELDVESKECSVLESEEIKILSPSKIDKIPNVQSSTIPSCDLTKVFDKVELDSKKTNNLLRDISETAVQKVSDFLKEIRNSPLSKSCPESVSEKCDKLSQIEDLKPQGDNSKKENNNDKNLPVQEADSRKENVNENLPLQEDDIEEGLYEESDSGKEDNVEEQTTKNIDKCAEEIVQFKRPCSFDDSRSKNKRKCYRLDTDRMPELKTSACSDKKYRERKICTKKCSYYRDRENNHRSSPDRNYYNHQRAKTFATRNHLISEEVKAKEHINNPRHGNCDRWKTCSPKSSSSMPECPHTLFARNSDAFRSGLDALICAANSLPALMLLQLILPKLKDMYLRSNEEFKMLDFAHKIIKKKLRESPTYISTSEI